MSLLEKIFRPANRRAVPDVTDRFVLHKLEKYSGIGSAIFIENLMADPTWYGDIEHRYNLLQADDQDGEEFTELADAALGISTGAIKRPIYCVPRRSIGPNGYPPLPGFAGEFRLVEDLAYSIDTATDLGKLDISRMHFIRYPGQSRRGLDEIIEHLREVTEKWIEKNGNLKTADAERSQWFDPGPPQKKFTL